MIRCMLAVAVLGISACVARQPPPLSAFSGSFQFDRLCSRGTGAGVVRGVVIADATGLPLASPQISVGVFPLGCRVSVDASGRFALEGLAPGGYRIYVLRGVELHPLFQDVGEVAVSVASAQVHWRELHVMPPNCDYEIPTGSVVGEVIDSRTGRPVVGAQVHAAGTSCGALTDSTGAFLLPRVPVGTHRLIIRRVGYASSVQDSIHISAGIEQTLSIRLSQTPVIIVH